MSYSNYDTCAREYGYSVDESGAICKLSGAATNVKLSQKKGRLYFRNADKSLLFSGSAKPETVAGFLESYWCATRVNQGGNIMTEPDALLKQMRDLIELLNRVA